MKKLLTILAVLALAVVAPAATITYNSTPVTVLLNSNTVQAFTLPQWDPTLFPLQALTGVQVSMSADMLWQQKVENLSGATLTGNLTTSANVTGSGTGVGALLVALGPIVNSPSLSAFDGVLDFGGTSGASFNGFVPSATNSTNVAAGFWASYTGPGTMAFNVNPNFFSDSGAFQGNGASQFVTNSLIGLSVTYTYEPSGVPEPSTFVLLGGALVGLGLLRRK